jgi:hypothetical protein
VWGGAGIGKAKNRGYRGQALKLIIMSRYIYLKNGADIVKQELLKGPAHKEQIIDKWRKLYGKKFESLHVIEDAPAVKKKKEKRRSSKYSYGHLLSTGKKSNKGFTRSWNGYKD